MVVVTVAFAVFLCVTVVVIHKSPLEITSLRTPSSTFERKVITFKSSKKSSSSYGDVDYEYYFTLSRENYDALPYFGTSRDEVVKYTVLDN